MVTPLSRIFYPIFPPSEMVYFCKKYQLWGALKQTHIAQIRDRGNLSNLMRSASRPEISWDCEGNRFELFRDKNLTRISSPYQSPWVRGLMDSNVLECADWMLIDCHPQLHMYVSTLHNKSWALLVSIFRIHFLNDLYFYKLTGLGPG